MTKHKKKTIITVIVAALVVFIGLVVAVLIISNNNSNGGSDGDVRNGNIASFSFGRGYGLGGAVGYTIARKDNNKASLKYEYFGFSSDEDSNFEKDIDAEYLDELADIIKEENIVKWDGFDKSDDGVLDGSGFSLKIKYDDGKEINAHGYMKFPDNYNEAENRLDAFLEKLKDV